VRIRGLAAIAAVTVSTIAAPAMAGKKPPPPVALPSCGPSDITASTATVLACNGFDAGNLLNQANAGTDQTILQSLGYSGWDGKIKDTAASVSNLGGTHTLNFGIQLTGISILAVHYGGGKGGPGQESTAFYVLDAAQGINQIHLAYAASSNAVLFVTGLPRHVVASVPEPASWATMLAGFGLIGGQMRRRRRVPATA